MSYKVGDYVKAPFAIYDDFPGTFIVTGVTRNLIGKELVKVVYADNPNGIGTTFYPSELLLCEDGERP